MDSWKAFDYINKKLITPRFLQMVEKWARYDGEDFSIGDADIFVSNKGIFKTSMDLPDIKFVGCEVQVDKTKMIPHITTYDVTEIKNVAVCSDYNTRILIARRGIKKEPDNIIFPNHLYIYAICGDGMNNKFGEDKMPSFETLKNNFEKEKYTPYNSLLHEFCHDYSLSPFNDCTDRIFNFTGIEGDLEALECDEDAKKLSRHIIAPKRLTRKQRDTLFKQLHPDITTTPVTK